MTSGEISWTPEPLPALDLLGMTDEQMTVAAVADAGAYRDLALAALEGLAAQDRQLAARDRTIAALRDELRRYVRTQMGAAA